MPLQQKTCPSPFTYSPVGKNGENKLQFENTFLLWNRFLAIRQLFGFTFSPILRSSGHFANGLEYFTGFCIQQKQLSVADLLSQVYRTTLVPAC